MRLLTAVAVVSAMFSASGAFADVVQIGESAFQASAGLIMFTEYALGTVNPVYAPSVYGGGAASPWVGMRRAAWAEGRL